jgi:hypothetical protein
MCDGRTRLPISVIRLGLTFPPLFLLASDTLQGLWRPFGGFLHPLRPERIIDEHLPPPRRLKLQTILSRIFREHALFRRSKWILAPKLTRKRNGNGRIMERITRCRAV